MSTVLESTTNTLVGSGSVGGGGGKRKRAATKGSSKYDWSTMNLAEYSNVHFAANPSQTSSASAVVKNGGGSYLEVISPAISCYGLSELLDKQSLRFSYSISHRFNAAEDTPEVNAYRAFLVRLEEHLVKYCDTAPDPLVAHPFLKDPNTGIVNRKVRDYTREPFVKYKIYPARTPKIKGGGGGEEMYDVNNEALLGVMLYDKDNNPLFGYDDKCIASFEARGLEVPERTYQAERAAIGIGCKVQIMFSVRLTSIGRTFYMTLCASQIKRRTLGSSLKVDADEAFGVCDDSGDEEEEQQQVVAVAASKKRPLEIDDGVVDDYAPPAKKAAVAAVAVADEIVEEEQEEEQEAAVAVAEPEPEEEEEAPPPPPTKKKKTIVAPKK